MHFIKSRANRCRVLKQLLPVLSTQCLQHVFFFHLLFRLLFRLLFPFLSLLAVLIIIYIFKRRWVVVVII